MTYRKAISIDELCSSLSIGRTKIYSLIAEGELEVLKIGRRTLVTTHSIESLIERSRVIQVEHDRKNQNAM